MHLPTGGRRDLRRRCWTARRGCARWLTDARRRRPTLQRSVLAAGAVALAAGAWPLVRTAGCCPASPRPGRRRRRRAARRGAGASPTAAVRRARWRHRRRLAALVLVGVIGLVVSAGVRAPLGARPGADAAAGGGRAGHPAAAGAVLPARDEAPPDAARDAALARRRRSRAPRASAWRRSPGPCWRARAGRSRTGILANAVPGARARTWSTSSSSTSAASTRSARSRCWRSRRCWWAARSGGLATPARRGRRGPACDGRRGTRSMLRRWSSPLLLPLALLGRAVYLFLRGHNLPGGGFIAGLVPAIGLILQYLACGTDWVDARCAARPAARSIGAGLLSRGRHGRGEPRRSAHPFLTSTYWPPRCPCIGKLRWPPPVVFDLGVLLTVVGATLLGVSRRLAGSGAPGVAPRPAEHRP